MKTIYLHMKKLSLGSLLGLLIVNLTSCGTTKNSSNPESDGIYATQATQTKTTVSTNNSSAYKQYFTTKELQSKDIVVYEDYDETLDSTEVAERSYSGWGENPSTVTVNVYDSGWDNWGMGIGWGMGMGWNNWGWGWNNWGWGWNSWYGPGWGWGWGWNNWYGPGWGMG